MFKIQNIDIKYNPIGVIKSQICSALVSSSGVRQALNFKGSDYDPDDPFSLIYSCVIPWLQHPDTITTTDPLIFVGVTISENTAIQYLLNATVTVICSLDKDDLKSTEGYFRKDLIDKGCICYTKADWIADEIIKCISSMSGTWIGDVDTIESTEYSMSSTRYTRNIGFRLRDINMGRLIQNGGR